MLELCNKRPYPIKIADLAAGIGWTSACLSKLEKVDEVIAVDISKHRMSELFEHSVKMMGGSAYKISRYVGSFYDLKIEAESVDLIYLSQAFHHADNPLLLLQECNRALIKGGRIILIGEHFISIYKIFRRFISGIIKERKVTTNFYELFKPNPILGDHYYRDSDYYFMFLAFGYKLKRVSIDKDTVIYIADKEQV